LRLSHTGRAPALVSGCPERSAEAHSAQFARALVARGLSRLARRIAAKCTGESRGFCVIDFHDYFDAITQCHPPAWGFDRLLSREHRCEGDHECKRVEPLRARAMLDRYGQARYDLQPNRDTTHATPSDPQSPYPQPTPDDPDIERPLTTWLRRLANRRDRERHRRDTSPTTQASERRHGKP